MTLEHANGWILFDDSCGFCRRWVPFWGSTLHKRGFGFAPLQADWVQAALEEFVPQERREPDWLTRDLLLLRPEGDLVHGADVYRAVMRRIAWAYPLYLLTKVPGLRQTFDGAYGLFKRNRFAVSSACRLPGRNPSVPSLQGDRFAHTIRLSNSTTGSSQARPASHPGGPTPRNGERVY